MSQPTPATNQSFYDRISHAYDLISDAGEHRARETGEQALDVQAGERVLEIGYGTGNTMIHLAEAVGGSGTVAGIDVSTGMQEVATKNWRPKVLQNESIFVWVMRESCLMKTTASMRSSQVLHWNYFPLMISLRCWLRLLAC